MFAQSPLLMLWKAPATSMSPELPAVRYCDERKVLPIRMPFTVFGRRVGLAS